MTSVASARVRSVPSVASRRVAAPYGVDDFSLGRSISSEKRSKFPLANLPAKRGPGPRRFAIGLSLARPREQCAPKVLSPPNLPSATRSSYWATARLLLSTLTVTMHACHTTRCCHATWKTLTRSAATGPWRRGKNMGIRATTAKLSWLRLPTANDAGLQVSVISSLRRLTSSLVVTAA